MWLTVAIASGAVFPVAAWPVATDHGTPYSLCVAVALASFGMLFPLYTIAAPQARAQVDPQAKSVRSLPTIEKEVDGWWSSAAGCGTTGWMGKLRRHSAKPGGEHIENRSGSNPAREEGTSAE